MGVGDPLPVFSSSDWWKGPDTGTDSVRSTERARSLEEAVHRKPGQGGGRPPRGGYAGAKSRRCEAAWSAGNTVRGLGGWSWEEWVEGKTRVSRQN